MDANEQRHWFVAEWVLVVFAAGILAGVWAGAGPARAQEAAAPEATTAPYRPQSPTVKRHSVQTFPAKPAEKRRVMFVTDEKGNTVIVPADENGGIYKPQFNPRSQSDPSPEPYGPHGRARAFRELARGDPGAWTVALGMLLTIVLAFAVSLAFRGPEKTAPDEIVATWQKQRGLCLTTAAITIPIAFVLAIALAVALEGPIGFVLGSCPFFFVGLVINMAKWRCPACGAGMGKNWNPQFCPKCGAALQGAQGAGNETPDAASDESNNSGGEPTPPSA